MMDAGLIQLAIIIVLIVQGQRAWGLRLGRHSDCGSNYSIKGLKFRGGTGISNKI